MKVTEIQVYIRIFTMNLKELQITPKMIKEKVYPPREGKGVKKQEWEQRLKSLNGLYYSKAKITKLLTQNKKNTQSPDKKT